VLDFRDVAAMLEVAALARNAAVMARIIIRMNV
jgi:hypothetical protein